MHNVTVCMVNLLIASYRSCVPLQWYKPSIYYIRNHIRLCGSISNALLIDCWTEFTDLPLSNFQISTKARCCGTVATVLLNNGTPGLSLFVSEKLFSLFPSKG